MIIKVRYNRDCRMSPLIGYIAGRLEHIDIDDADIVLSQPSVSSVSYAVIQADEECLKIQLNDPNGSMSFSLRKGENSWRADENAKQNDCAEE